MSLTRRRLLGTGAAIAVAGILGAPLRRAYAGVTPGKPFDGQEVNVLSVQATQFADNMYLNEFSPLQLDQRLAVPATNMRIRGNPVTGVPIQLKDAIAELAIIAITTNLIEVQTARNAIQRTVKVGDVSKSETFSTDGYRRVFHPVEMLLRPLLGNTQKLGDGVATFAMQRV